MNAEIKEELENTSSRLYLIYKNHIDDKTTEGAAIANLISIAYQAIDAAIEIEGRPF